MFLCFICCHLNLGPDELEVDARVRHRLRVELDLHRQTHTHTKRLHKHPKTYARERGQQPTKSESSCSQGVVVVVFCC